MLVVRGGQVHVINPQARTLLGVGGDAADTLPVPLTRLLPAPLLEDPTPESPVPVTVRDRPLLVGVRPTPDGAQVVTLRDLARMRAQTHEFTHRLHTLAGLLHLGETREALNLIYAQSSRHAAHADAVRSLRHVRLAALVLGKYERAAELGLTLTLDPLTALPDPLPPGVLDLIELGVGNLLENACEALDGQPGGEVRLLIAHDPEGLVVEVRDNGPGVPPPLAATLVHDRVTDPAGRPWTRFTLELPL